MEPICEPLLAIVFCTYISCVSDLTGKGLGCSWNFGQMSTLYHPLSKKIHSFSHSTNIAWEPTFESTIKIAKTFLFLSI